MNTMNVSEADRASCLASLAAMPAYLERALSGLSAEEARTPGAEGSFSPVEHVRHLADLESEGYGERIRRLVGEDEPWLPDFDGARIAAERDYRSSSLQEGLALFAAARARNLSAFRAADEQAWARRGVQQGVGPISLCDLPRSMAEHDAAHREEIEGWLRTRAP